MYIGVRIGFSEEITSEEFLGFFLAYIIQF